MALLNKLQKLLLKRIHPEDFVNLTSRRIYILPTREGIIFALLVLIMLAAAINFNNSLIFFFTFLMASVGVISMYMTQQNLIGLQFSLAHVPPVFLYQSLQLPLTISCSKSCYSIAIDFNMPSNKSIHTSMYTDIISQESTQLALSTATEKRGRFSLKALTISSRFPLGLFRAWANIELNHDAIIYPEPESVKHFSPPHGSDTEGSNPYGTGLEDFSGFKNYQTGEPLSHIHWKAFAKEQGLLSKTFSGSSHKEYWLNWSEVFGHIEQKLSQLCQLIIEAEHNGDRYGLILPGQSIAISSGLNHYHSCLKTLALYQSKSIQ